MCVKPATIPNKAKLVRPHRARGTRIANAENHEVTKAKAIAGTYGRASETNRKTGPLRRNAIDVATARRGNLAFLPLKMTATDAIRIALVFSTKIACRSSLMRVRAQ